MRPHFDPRMTLSTTGSVLSVSPRENLRIVYVHCSITTRSNVDQTNKFKKRILPVLTYILVQRYDANASYSLVEDEKTKRFIALQTMWIARHDYVSHDFIICIDAHTAALWRLELPAFVAREASGSRCLSDRVCH